MASSWTEDGNDSSNCIFDAFSELTKVHEMEITPVMKINTKTKTIARILDRIDSSHNIRFNVFPDNFF